MTLKTIQDLIEEKATDKATKELSALTGKFYQDLNALSPKQIGDMVVVKDAKEIRFFQWLEAVRLAFLEDVIAKAKTDATKAFLKKVEDTAAAVDELRDLIPAQ